MENNFFRRIPTDLDLNGPVLAYTTQPSDATGNKDASVTFTVAAEATFPNDTGATDGGTITFQWFEDGTALSNSGQFSGVTTTTLTVSDLKTPQDQGRKFYCEISYSVNDEYGSADSGTGIGLNAPLKSDEATLSVNPELNIVTQPVSRTVGKNIPATFTIGASLTDDSYLSDGAITYQWYVGLGNATPTLVTDGTVATTSVSTQSVTSVDENLVTQVDTYTNSKSFGVGSGNVNIPSTAFDVSFTIGGGEGGKGGRDAGTPDQGMSGGRGRVGTFTIPNAEVRSQNLKFEVGSKGNDGGQGQYNARGLGGRSEGASAPGGNGGGAGPSGWSGGGGGGGGGSAVIRNSDNRMLAIAGGGGGGGGASWDRAGEGGANITGFDWTATTDTLAGRFGFDGSDASPDGGGGGANGGGANIGNQGNAGGSGIDKQSGGKAGDGGRSGYRSDSISLSSSGTNTGNGYGNIDWKYTETSTYPETETREDEIVITTVQNTTISGQGTDTLSITSDESSFNAIRKLYCIVSHVTATNSPVTSDTVTSAVVNLADTNTIVVETISANPDGDLANQATIDLSNGDQEFNSGSTDLNNGQGGYLHRFYAPNKDIVVEMDLFGGKGSDNGANSGGDGGYSRIRFTMERNVEYVIAGLIDSVNTPYIYKKAVLIANVGQGGAAGERGRGGSGGGVNNSGENGIGRGGGDGGNVATTRSTNGTFGSLTALTAVAPDTKATTPDGGVTATCTRGVYWRDQGVSACSDVDAGPLPDVVYQAPEGGFPKFRSSDGTEIESTGWVNSGYKTGYNIIQTAGKKETLISGNGGNGSVGGGGGSDGRGGGGGAGYVDSSVTVVDTQLGGSNFADAKVILRAVPEDELDPASNTRDVIEVQFIQTRTSDENIEIVLTKVEGTGEGPPTITLGSPTGFVGGRDFDLLVNIQEGTIYNVSATTNVDQRSLNTEIKASKGGGKTVLVLSDTDATPGTLNINTQNGRWTSLNRFEAFAWTTADIIT